MPAKQAETRKKITNWLAKPIREGKYKNRAEFVETYMDEYHPEALAYYYDLIKMRMRTEGKKPTRSQFKVIQKEVNNLKGVIMAKNKERQEVDITELTEALGEKLKNVVSKDVLDNVKKELNTLKDDIAQCVRDGTCSPEQLDAMLSEKLAAIEQKEPTIDLAPIKSIEQKIDTVFSEMKGPEHVHRTAAEVMDCPECGPIMVNAVRERLKQEKEVKKVEELPAGEEKPSLSAQIMDSVNKGLQTFSKELGESLQKVISGVTPSIPETEKVPVEVEEETKERISPEEEKKEVKEETQKPFVDRMLGR